jgi:hypothetical protein
MKDETSQEEEGNNSRYKHKACPETNRKLSKKKRDSDIPTYIMDMENAASTMSIHKPNGTWIYVKQLKAGLIEI